MGQRLEDYYTRLSERYDIKDLAGPKQQAERLLDEHDDWTLLINMMHPEIKEQIFIKHNPRTVQHLMELYLPAHQATFGRRFMDG